MCCVGAFRTTGSRPRFSSGCRSRCIVSLGVISLPTIRDEDVDDISIGGADRHV